MTNKQEHREFQLSEFSPEWKNTFNKIKVNLEKVLDKDFLLEVEHIGSTSIPGMIAKPQVDVLVVVRNLSEFSNKHKALIDAGFTYHGLGYVNMEDDYFSLNENGKRIASIHVLQEGNSKILEYKIFRDYLIENEEDRNLYIKTKQNLYNSNSSDYPSYSKGKGEIIGAIIERSRIWFNNKHK